MLCLSGLNYILVGCPCLLIVAIVSFLIGSKTVFKIRQKSHLTTSCLRESHAMLFFSCFSKKCHAMKSRYGDRLMKHCFCVESCINTVLVLSFKTSKLNQAVFNQGKLKSISINLQERPRKRFYEYAILCQRY